MGKLSAKSSWHRAAILLFGATMLAVQTAKGIEATSEIYMATATVIPGVSSSGPNTAYFSPPVVKPAVYAGVISTIGPVSFTDTNADWQLNQFNGSAGQHYVEFANGMMADIIATDAQRKTLTFTENLPASITANMGYRIRPHLTLGTVFGPANETGLLGGANSVAADNILLYAPQLPGTLTYFYVNLQGYSGWYRNDYQPARDTIIYPEQGVMLSRKAPEDVVLYWQGVVKTTTTVVPVFQGYNLVGTLKGSRSLTLSELNLYTGNSASGLAAGSNPNTADTVVVVRPDNTTATFFYSDFTGFTGWFDTSYRPANQVSIPPTSTFFINRKAPRGLFYWSIPGE